jgi:hypothetical protein
MTPGWPRRRGVRSDRSSEFGKRGCDPHGRRDLLSELVVAGGYVSGSATQRKPTMARIAASARPITDVFLEICGNPGQSRAGAWVVFDEVPAEN